MWEQLHQYIQTLVYQGIHDWESCDGTDRDVLFYAFLKDVGYEVTEYLTDTTLLNAMEEMATLDAGLLLFWQTIANLDYSELKQRYLNSDFEWQVEDTCCDIFNDYVADYLAEQTEFNRYATDDYWMQEIL